MQSSLNVHFQRLCVCVGYQLAGLRQVVSQKEFHSCEAEAEAGCVPPFITHSPHRPQSSHTFPNPWPTEAQLCVRERLFCSLEVSGCGVESGQVHTSAQRAPGWCLNNCTHPGITAMINNLLNSRLNGQTYDQTLTTHSRGVSLIPRFQDSLIP